MRPNTFTPLGKERESQIVEQFAKLTNDYIELIESLPNVTAYSFLKRCAILLPQIYAAAYQLPKSCLLSQSLNQEIPDVDFGFNISISAHAISSLLGEHNFYFEVFDPVTDQESIGQTSISDDLSDIYHDLRKGFLLYKLNTEVCIDEALWEWQFSLESHFGDHLVDVLRPIQRLISLHMPVDFVATTD